MNKKILAHFSSADPTISVLFTRVTIQHVAPRHPREFFVSLCSEIIGQQLSGKVAEVIEGRFTKLFKGPITPRKVDAMPEEKLRATGMSWAKVRFIKDLSQNVLQKKIDLQSLTHLKDEDVMRELTKIKGIGPWTAEMFLMFTLGREDVFSFGDLGLRRAIQKAYRLRREPTRLQLMRLSKKWSPYRTWAALILWKSLEL